MIIFSETWKDYTKELFTPRASALQGLSFSVKHGETLGLIGANGAGKSTTIRLILGFIRADKGLVQVFNTTPDKSLVRKNIGYLPETATPPANLSILNLLRFTSSTCKITSSTFKQRSEELLKELELWNVRKRPLRTYSKGMQQRANFALALINDPELLILDEPMSGLDPIGRDKIINLIIRLKERGKTILFCSHILDDVDKVADNILLLHKGKKIFHGTPSEFIRQEDTENLTEAFVSAVEKKEA